MSLKCSRGLLVCNSPKTKYEVSEKIAANVNTHTHQTHTESSAPNPLQQNILKKEKENRYYKDNDDLYSTDTHIVKSHSVGYVSDVCV